MRKHFYFNLLNILSKLLNFILFWFVANHLGASIQSDWFFYIFGVVFFLITIFFFTAEFTLVTYWNGFSDEETIHFIQLAVLFSVITIIPLQIAGFFFSFSTPGLFDIVVPENHFSTLITSAFFLFILQ